MTFAMRNHQNIGDPFYKYWSNPTDTTHNQWWPALPSLVFCLSMLGPCNDICNAKSSKYCWPLLQILVKSNRDNPQSRSNPVLSKAPPMIIAYVQCTIKILPISGQYLKLQIQQRQPTIKQLPGITALHFEEPPTYDNCHRSVSACAKALLRLRMFARRNQKNWGWPPCKYWTNIANLRQCWWPCLAWPGVLLRPSYDSCYQSVCVRIMQS